MTESLWRIVSLPAVEAAPLLLGCIFRFGKTAGKIVEVEAYSEEDPASHSFGGMRHRNRHMFLGPGHLYVYRSYGVHWCVNIVVGAEGSGEAVLIRSLEPTMGISTMKRRRNCSDLSRLCCGPGCVAAAMGITGKHSGLLLGEGIADLEPPSEPIPIMVSTRIGIRKAADWQRRFFIAGNPYVSHNKRGKEFVVPVGVMGYEVMG
ncbi:MAG TPA: DNA-3-methyladenine glycosylase [Fimbriimonadales bacterium]|nr:DNA-3-methyladenine glycosylase [Fimbriimonadales bacterium]